MKRALQKTYGNLKDKAMTQFHVTGVLPMQSIAITRDFIQMAFNRDRPIIPAGALGIAPKGYIQLLSAIQEGFVVAVFSCHFGNITRHHLFDIEPDYVNLDRKNLLWFELNSRVLTIREAYYVDYSTTPLKLKPISSKKFDNLVYNKVEEMFRLDS
jgi:hypothetical protein